MENTDFDLDVLSHYISELEDVYVGKSSFLDMFLDAPLYASFCGRNKRRVTRNTIVAMAIQIICEDYKLPYYYGVDDYVERFKEVSLKHILNIDEDK